MSTTQQHDELVSGEIVAERYRVERFLGEGGMGRVYLATDLLLASEEDQPLVAIKLLREELGLDEKYRRRFLREVSLTRAITHHNVIRTFEVGQYAGRTFFTMEYVDGAPLSERFAGTPVPARTAISILSDIASGLHAIHLAGVLHRDLKPANVIMTASGEVKISDFGIARPAVSQLTQQHEMLGSSYYMAPEVWKGEQVSEAADVYSLGVLAYELFTGVVPFDGGAEPEVMWKHIEQPLTPAIVVVPSVPSWVSELISGMLAKDPESRPTTEEILHTIASHDGERIDSRNGARGAGSADPSVVEGLGPDELLEATIEFDSLEARERLLESTRKARESIEANRGSIQSAAVERDPKVEYRRYLVRVSGIFSLGPILAAVFWWVVLPQIGRSWETVGSASAGYFIGLSVVMFLSIGMFCSTPVFCAAAFTGSLARAVEFYYLVSSRLATLCGIWYLGLHGLQRVGLNPRGNLAAYRATIGSIVEQIAEQALRLGFMMPFTTPIGGSSTFIALKYPWAERIVYLVVMSLFFYGVCGYAAKCFNLSATRRSKLLLFAVLGVVPQLAGYFLQELAVKQPASFLAARQVVQFGNLKFEFVTGGVVLGALVWGAIIVLGAVCLGSSRCQVGGKSPHSEEMIDVERRKPLA